jgi:23S rRNA (guanosine2251-2'-O)-methyltransferase
MTTRGSKPGTDDPRHRDARGSRRRTHEPRGVRDEANVLFGRRPVLESLRAGRSAERLLVARDMARSPVVADIRRRARKAGIPVQLVPRAEIDRAAPGGNHQGVVALGSHYRYTGLERVVGAAGAAVLFLDRVVDPNNLGALLRSAEGAGLSGVVIPARRAASVTPAVRRVSAGASEVLPVARVANLSTAIDRARAAGLWIVGLDPDAPTDVWTSEVLEPPVGLVLGSEDRGLSRVVRARCDALVSIPMRGRVGSLNVASAGAIAMFEIVRRAEADGARQSPVVV